MLTVKEPTASSLRSDAGTLARPLPKPLCKTKIGIITVEGPLAVLEGIPVTVLEACLKFDDPKRFSNLAFRQHRWDGKQRLFAGRVFPAGLLHRVEAQLQTEKLSYRVQRDAPRAFDLERITPKFLEGYTLRPEQIAGAKALLRAGCSYLQAPTGSGKTLICAVVAKFLVEEGLVGMLITPRRGLVHKTVDVFRQVMGDTVQVGQCGDGVKKIGEITVTTGASLLGYQSRTMRKAGRLVTIPPNPDIEDMVKNSDFIIYDEAHRCSGDTWYNVGLTGKSVLRMGVSATPESGYDLNDAKLEAVTGPCVFRVNEQQMITEGTLRSVKVAVLMSDRVSGAVMPDELRTFRGDDGELRTALLPPPYDDAYQRAYVECASHNQTVINSARWLASHGRMPVIMCFQRDHFEKLEMMLQRSGVQLLFRCGGTIIPRSGTWRLQSFRGGRCMSCWRRRCSMKARTFRRSMPSCWRRAARTRKILFQPH